MSDLIEGIAIILISLFLLFFLAFIVIEGTALYGESLWLKPHRL